MSARRPSRTVRRGAPLSWRVLIYRVPTEPASKRVAVWRDLKRLGALYLQQCVCIFPDLPGVVDDVNQVAAKIPALGGETFVLEVPRLQTADESRIVEAFREQRANEYAEIIEECETKFVKEIEFERFRENYTFEEAEEIEQDLEKIRRWFDRVKERDWFKADPAVGGIAARRDGGADARATSHYPVAPNARACSASEASARNLTGVRPPAAATKPKRLLSSYT